MNNGTQMVPVEIEIDTNWPDDDEPTLVLPQADMVDIAMACDRVTLPYLPAEEVELGIADSAFSIANDNA